MEQKTKIIAIFILLALLFFVNISPKESLLVNENELSTHINATFEQKLFPNYEKAELNGICELSEDILFINSADCSFSWRGFTKNKIYKMAWFTRYLIILASLIGLSILIYPKTLKSKQIRTLIILILTVIIFLINLPAAEQSPEEPQLNLVPLNVTINKTIPIIDFEGNIIGNVTTTVNKTIILDKSLPAKTKSMQEVIPHLGEKVFPSNPIMGWIVIFLIGYFVVWPTLKWIKEIFWG